MIGIGKLLLTLVTLASVAQGVPPLPPSTGGLTSQEGLAHLFFSSRITAQDPMQSMACFAGYITESNHIGQQYSTDYKQCLVNATESRQVVDIEARRDRQGIEISSEGVCIRLHDCNGQNNTLDMFNCHANVGANNTKTTYTISGNAAEYATLLQERYRLIDLHHEQCCHAAERAYVEYTADNYNHLQSCLNGQVPPKPTRAPTTTSTTPPTTTTTTSTTTTTTEATTTSIGPLNEEPTEPQLRIQEQFAQLLNLLN